MFGMLGAGASRSQSTRAHEVLLQTQHLMAFKLSPSWELFRERRCLPQAKHFPQTFGRTEAEKNVMKIQ